MDSTQPDERPKCPTCHGKLKRMTVGGEVPCTNCDGGYMRGIDDPTPDELRIAELQDQLRAARATVDVERDAAREALAPFAKFPGDYQFPRDPDATVIERADNGATLTVGDWRRARTALRPPDPAAKGAEVKRGWGTCVDCPRDPNGRTYPDRCANRERYDHNIPWPQKETP